MMHDNGEFGACAAAETRLGALFASNAIPAIASMVLTSGVVLVDGAFLGRIVGPDALAAVNLGLPLLYAFMGAALLVAVGFSSPATVALGAGDGETARRWFSAAAATVAAVSAAAALAVWAALDPLAAFLAGGGVLSGTLRAYLGVMVPGYVFMMLNMTLSVFIRAEGRPALALAVGLAANIANIVMDWLFVAVFGWGVRGAAAATGLASAVGCAIGLAYIVAGGSAFSFVRPRFKPAAYVRALGNGLSEMIGQYSVMITTWLLNAACLRLMGRQGLAALAVAGYISFMQSMVVTGLCIGMAPIAGRAFGAGDGRTAAGVFRMAAVVAFVFGCASFLLTALGGRAAAAFWTGGDMAVAALAARGFAIFGAGFLLNGFNALAAAWFTARCDAGRSGLIAALRGLALPSACILILPAMVGQTGIWLAMPVAEALTLAYALPAMSRALGRST